MSSSPPPLDQQITGQNNETVPQWLLWFDSVYRGDAGTEWTPTFSGLTEVGGSATITGRYFRLSRYLMYFSIVISPATNTSAVAGTTYCDNFPIDVVGDGVCFAVTGNVGGNAGQVVSSNDRIYVPGWTTITTDLTIVGICEAS